MRTAAIIALGLLVPFAACDEAEGRPFDAGDGRTLTLLSVEAETKEAAIGRTVGYLVAAFAKPEGLQGTERRPLVEWLCPRILTEAGAPEEVEGTRLRTVLVKERAGGRENMGFSFGSFRNYWVDPSRGECVVRS